jgi:hypothetical protein
MHGQCTRVNVALFTLPRRRMYNTAFCTCLSSSYAIASSCYDASREGWSAARVSLDRHDSSSHLTVSLILPSTRRHRPTIKHSSDVSLILHLCPHSSSCSACGRYALHTARFVYSSDGKTSATCRTASSRTPAASPRFSTQTLVARCTSRWMSYNSSSCSSIALSPRRDTKEYPHSVPMASSTCNPPSNNDRGIAFHSTHDMNASRSAAAASRSRIWLNDTTTLSPLRWLSPCTACCRETLCLSALPCPTLCSKVDAYTS